jgi:arylsulfatase
MYRNEYIDHLKERGLLKDYIKDINYRFEHGDWETIVSSPLPPDDYPDGYIGIKGMKYIRDCPKDKPMFLPVSFPGPHTPFDAPGKYGAMFDPTNMLLDESVPGEIAERARGAGQLLRQTGASGQPYRRPD